MIALHGWTPLEPRGLTITDPAAVIASRAGVALNQEQADALRRRVVEVRASLQRWADSRGTTVAEEARRRLADRAADRNRTVYRVYNTQPRVIAGPHPLISGDGREWSPS